MPNPDFTPDFPECVLHLLNAHPGNLAQLPGGGAVAPRPPGSP